MRDVMVYSGIVTKIRAMRSRLLKAEDYHKLAESQTVTDVIAYLKGTKAYGKLLDEMDVSLYHRGNIEKMLVRSLYDDYTRLYRFSNQQQRQFLKLILNRYEVDVINHCLRIVFNHYEMTFDLDHKKDFFDKYSDISIEKITGSNNVEELVEHLKGTEYYGPLSRVRDAGATELLDYDLALNLYYYSQMWKQGRKVLSKADLEVYTRNLGTEIDLLNLQWIYRAKKYYNMLAPDLYAMLIPIQYRLSKAQFKALVEAPSLEEFFRILNDGTSYGRKYTFDEKDNVEAIVNHHLEYLYMTAYRKKPYSMASLVSYLFMKEKEIKIITTVLECVRYGLPPAKTLQYVKQYEKTAGGQTA